VKWVEVKAVVVAGAVAAVLAEVAGVGRVGWVVPPLPAPVVPACAPVVGTGCRTCQVNLATRRSARSVARRWCASDKLVRGYNGGRLFGGEKHGPGGYGN
jgi:hypothetical protein